MSKSILIVEDQPDALDILVYLFTLEGYKVIAAHNGQEGFNMAQKEHPDLILTDIMMPILDGVDMIKQVRQDRQLQKVPVIVMTAFGEDKTQMAITAGANETIQKPLRFDTLLGMTAHLISAPPNLPL